MERLGDRMLKELGYSYKVEYPEAIEYHREYAQVEEEIQDKVCIIFGKQDRKVSKIGGENQFSFEEIKAINQKILDLENKSKYDMTDWLINREDSIGKSFEQRG